MTELVGGRYEIVRKIAEGGMGAVYEAKHHMTKKTVALKVLFPHIGKNDASKQRFFREVSAAAQIGHPGIVDCFDSGVDPNDGSLFVAMELLQGETMGEWLARGGHSPDTILNFFDQLLEPVASAHARGIVHRDLKPDNVFLSRTHDGSWRVKILDFGIARDLDTSQDNVTHTGIAMGTPHYMAPEQAMSARGVLATADVWALGAMLYEALSGRPPFDGETASAIVVHACTQPHAPVASAVPHIPPSLAQLIDRCLAKEPSARPSDAGELRRLLRQARGGGAGAAVAGSHAHPASPHTEGTNPSPITGEGLIRDDRRGYGSGAQHTPPASGPGGGASGMSGGFGAPSSASSPAALGSNHSFGQGAGGGAAAGSNSFGGAPQATPPPRTRSRAGLIIGALVGLLLLMGLGALALVMLAGSDDTPMPPTNGPVAAQGIGTVQVMTDIRGGGELLVNGEPHGLVVSGQNVRISAGEHRFEIRVAGQIVGRTEVRVMPDATTIAALNRGGNGPAATNNGVLEAGDRTLDSGELADHYTYQWSSGQVHIEVKSAAFDAYLIVKSPSGQQHENDDMAGAPDSSRDAGLDLAITEPGTWTVLVTSYQAGESGAYELSVRQME